MELRGVLLDLDGVVYEGGEPIDGARETVQWVRARGLPHLFLTNTTSRGRDALVERLGRCGIRATRDDIWSPIAATAAWLRAHEPGPVALFVRDAVRPEFGEFELLPDSAESGARYVVISDLAEAWDYAALNRAFRLLHSDPRTGLLALGMTRYWSTPTGISLDVAPFVVALAHAADREPVVLGKPAPEFFAAAAARIGVAPGALLMVGDDVVTDVGGAQRAGLKGALVRTGKFRPVDLEGEVVPDAVLGSIADLPRWWEETVS